MSDDSSRGRSAPEPGRRPELSPRDRRRAEALRENLKRRKAQDRGRAEAGEDRAETK